MLVSALKLVLLWLALHAAAALFKHLYGCKRLGVGICSVSVKSRAFNRYISRVVPCFFCTMLGLASLTMVAPCRLFHRLGRHRHALLRQWFGVGVLTAAMLGTSAVFLLLKEVVNAMIWVKEVGGSPCTGWLLHLSAQWVPAGPCTPCSLPKVAFRHR